VTTPRAVDAAAVELDDWGEKYYQEDSSRYRRPGRNQHLRRAPSTFSTTTSTTRAVASFTCYATYSATTRSGSSIGHYLRKHRTGSVETRDLARAVEEATGRVLDWFFDQWVLKGRRAPRARREIRVGAGPQALPS